MKEVYRKPHLPEKTCAACGRPFAWRKRWARQWEQVAYCSEACRRKARRSRDLTQHHENV